MSISVGRNIISAFGLTLTRGQLAISESCQLDVTEDPLAVQQPFRLPKWCLDELVTTHPTIETQGLRALQASCAGERSSVKGEQC